MIVEINISEERDASERVIAVYAEALVMTSPREGYTPAKVAALERDLSRFVNERVNDALIGEEVRE